MNWTRKFWLSVLENVLVIDLTAFITLAGGTHAVREVDWEVTGWGLIIATAGAVLKSLIAKRKGDPQTANFVS